MYAGASGDNSTSYRVVLIFFIFSFSSGDLTPMNYIIRPYAWQPKRLGVQYPFCPFWMLGREKKSHTIFLLESRDFLRPKRQHAYIFRLCYLMYSIIPRYLSRPFSLIGCMKTFFLFPMNIFIEDFPRLYILAHLQVPSSVWCVMPFSSASRNAT